MQFEYYVCYMLYAHSKYVFLLWTTLFSILDLSNKTHSYILFCLQAYFMQYNTANLFFFFRTMQIKTHVNTYKCEEWHEFHEILFIFLYFVGGFWVKQKLIIINIKKWQYGFIMVSVLGKTSHLKFTWKLYNR